MKKCDCPYWIKYVGTYFEDMNNVDDLSAFKITQPLYFGAPIYYCPYCSKKLKEG